MTATPMHVWAYQRQDRFGDFYRKDLKQYPVWVDTVRAFRAHYKLGCLRFRQLDKFLWSEGARLIKK